MDKTITHKPIFMAKLYNDALKHGTIYCWDFLSLLSLTLNKFTRSYSFNFNPGTNTQQ